MQSLSFVSYFITMSFILYCYIPQLLSAGKVKTTNKRPYVGVNGVVEGVVIQSDNPLCYEEGGEFPPYEGVDADTLGGKPASDYVLDSELTEALAGKADAVHTHEIAQVNGLQTALDGKSPMTHNHNGVYAPVSHTHEIAQVNGLQNQLNGKANSSHTHPASQISAGTLSGSVVANAGAVSNIRTKQVRNIYAGTSDIGVGTPLTTGDIYLIYE